MNRKEVFKRSIIFIGVLVLVGVALYAGLVGFLFLLVTGVFSSATLPSGAMVVSGVLLAVIAAVLCFTFLNKDENKAKLRSSLKIIILLATLLGVAYLYSRYIDWPVSEDVIVERLVQLEGVNEGDITKFYNHNLGGFVDRRSSWMIDADNETIKRLIGGLGLNMSNIISESDVTKVRSHWWPNSVDGLIVYQSKNFPFDGRGADGEHILLLHDPAVNRAYVWVKSNF